MACHLDGYSIWTDAAVAAASAIWWINFINVDDTATTSTISSAAPMSSDSMLDLVALF